jgi:hypothetical protein
MTREGEIGRFRFPLMQCNSERGATMMWHSYKCPPLRARRASLEWWKRQADVVGYTCGTLGRSPGMTRLSRSRSGILMRISGQNLCTLWRDYICNLSVIMLFNIVILMLVAYKRMDRYQEGSLASILLEYF